MNRLSIFLLIDIKGDWLPIHFLFGILLSVALHAEKDRSRDPLVAVQIRLTMALPAKFLLRLHDLFVGQSPGEREGRDKPSKKKEKDEEEKLLPHFPFFFLLGVFV